MVGIKSKISGNEVQDRLFTVQQNNLPKTIKVQNWWFCFKMEDSCNFKHKKEESIAVELPL